MYRAFAVDSLASSHPLSCKEEEVNTPTEIIQMFNTISYSKVKSFIVFRSINPYVQFTVFFMDSFLYLRIFCFMKSFNFGNLLLIGKHESNPIIAIPNSIGDQ